ncbi:MAG: SGNH/GDSL hydrolase family protein [Pirellulaceae bacterium]
MRTTSIVLPAMSKRLLSFALCLTVTLVYGARAMSAEEAAEENPSARWESDIRKFEQADKASPPEKGGVVFIGSSSIKRWNLKETFPGKQDYLNRGFGGSQIADSIYFADRILIPYQPRAVVLYAGDNDLAKGKTPKRVAADFAQFVEKVHAALPKTKIVFVAIKPSLARWNIVGKVRSANKMIAKQCQQNELLTYVDVDTPMLGEDGKPRESLFVSDGLHLSQEGYELWVSLVAPHLAPGKK